MDAGMIIMLVGWLIVIIWIPLVVFNQRKYHPRALFTLFFAELWERFSFYGMRSLLVLYMTKVLFDHLTIAQADERAYGIYGAYGALVYGAPVLGGMLADRFMGFRNAIIWGGILMAVGHFIMTFEHLSIFFIALSLIVAGNGFFKPNISSFLGTFYEKDDPRKDRAFTIFYMGINVGAFLAPVTCGYLGETYGWHYGFGLAGLGMVIGVLVFWRNLKHMGDKGLPPNPEQYNKKVLAGLTPKHLIILGSIAIVPLFSFLLNVNELMSLIMIILGVLILGILIYQAFRHDKVDGQRLGVIIILAFFHTLFWAFFEQAGSSLTTFADRNVDRVVLGSEIPTSMFQSVNPLFIVLLAPLISWLWSFLKKRKMEPYTPSKFSLGLLQLGLGFGVLVLGGMFFSGSDALVPLVFLILMYLLHTTGELFLSPVGLSMVTKLSPGKIVGFVMGAWFLSIAFAHHLAGIIAKYTSAPPAGAEEVTASDTLPIYMGVYWQGTLLIVGAAIVLMLLMPLLRKMMHNIH